MDLQVDTRLAPLAGKGLGVSAFPLLVPTAGLKLDYPPSSSIYICIIYTIFVFI